MMRRVIPLAIAALGVIGCGSGSDVGEVPPPVKPITQQQLDTMPPEAAAAAKAAQERGAAMAAGYNDRYKGSGK